MFFFSNFTLVDAKVWNLAKIVLNISETIFYLQITACLLVKHVRISASGRFFWAHSLQSRAKIFCSCACLNYFTIFVRFTATLNKRFYMLIFSSFFRVFFIFDLLWLIALSFLIIFSQKPVVFYFQFPFFLLSFNQVIINILKLFRQFNVLELIVSNFIIDELHILLKISNFINQFIISILFPLRFFFKIIFFILESS